MRSLYACGVAVVILGAVACGGAPDGTSGPPSEPASEPVGTTSSALMTGDGGLGDAGNGGTGSADAGNADTGTGPSSPADTGAPMITFCQLPTISTSSSNVYSPDVLTAAADTWDQLFFYSNLKALLNQRFPGEDWNTYLKLYYYFSTMPGCFDGQQMMACVNTPNFYPGGPIFLIAADDQHYPGALAASQEAQHSSYNSSVDVLYTAWGQADGTTAGSNTSMPINGQCPALWKYIGRGDPNGTIHQ